MTLNVELLERVKAHILEEPKRLAMGTFAERNEEAPCGTVACIAGWSLVLEKGARMVTKKLADFGEGYYEDHFVYRNNRPIDDPHEHAKKILGLTEEEAMTLFYVEDWPDDLTVNYMAAKRPDKRALITAARIDRLIAGHTAGSASR